MIKNFLPDLSLIKEILIIGIPSVLMQAIGTVMTLCMNAILIGFSNTALNVFGVYFKLQSFVFMPVFGLNNGMVPIVSYNYGAKNKKRVFDTMKLSYFTAKFASVDIQCNSRDDLTWQQRAPYYQLELHFCRLLDSQYILLPGTR